MGVLIETALAQCQDLEKNVAGEPRDAESGFMKLTQKDIENHEDEMSMRSSARSS